MVSVEASESTWLTSNERMAVKTKVVEKMRGIFAIAIDEAMVESITNVESASNGSARRLPQKNQRGTLPNYIFIIIWKALAMAAAGAAPSTKGGS